MCVLYSYKCDRHKLHDDARIDMYQMCNDWMKAKGDKRYMGGDKPNLADLVRCMSPTHKHTNTGSIWCNVIIHRLSSICRYSTAHTNRHMV
jgi:hypothetical protein